MANRKEDLVKFPSRSGGQLLPPATQSADLPTEFRRFFFRKSQRRAGLVYIIHRHQGAFLGSVRMLKKAVLALFNILLGRQSEATSAQQLPVGTQQTDQGRNQVTGGR